MLLTEAIKIIREYSLADLPVCRVRLITGFNALHLRTLLLAHLQCRIPGKRVIVPEDVYGDVLGAVARVQTSNADMCVIALEWPDLDPRLGFRRLGGWGPKDLADIAIDARSRFAALREGLEGLSDRFPVALSLPTLALPPVFHTSSWQLSEAEADLRLGAGELARWASGRPNLRLVRSSMQSADMQPTERDRYASPGFDFKGEVMAGLPYTMVHADQLAQSLAQVLAPPMPKKGLITDLDDTLWAGIAGEVGPDQVSWDLDGQAHLHGLYQQLLRALADQGVLIGVASKNDPKIVEAVLRRVDMVLPRDRIFPVEADWNPKSESVSRILDTWNVHADSVVFVDDSASELAEAKAAHPELECIPFDGRDYEGVHRLLYGLRDLFARQAITTEDGLRRESVRVGSVFRAEAQSTGDFHEKFLRDAEARITFDFAAAGNPRSLELVNKTNQFNLNGVRYSESEWRRDREQANAFAVSASYRDKYGPLGVIAVLAGQASETAVTVGIWVMSCRAFGRRIEYWCLRAILDRFPVAEIGFEFSPTPRNEYLQEFAKSFLGERPTGRFRISRTAFLEKCPKLYHEVGIPDEIDHE